MAYQANNIAIYIKLFPLAELQGPATLWMAGDPAGSFTDLKASDTAFTLRKYIRGDEIELPTSKVYSADTPYEFLIYQHSTGMGITYREDGGAWAEWETLVTSNGKKAMPVDEDILIGNWDGINQFASRIAGFSVIAIAGSDTPIEQIDAAMPWLNLTA